MFLDDVTITVTGGKGGDGAATMRREAHDPRGGAGGGGGGRGRRRPSPERASRDAYPRCGYRRPARRSRVARPGGPGRAWRTWRTGQRSFRDGRQPGTDARAEGRAGGGAQTAVRAAPDRGRG